MLFVCQKCTMLIKVREITVKGNVIVHIQRFFVQKSLCIYVIIIFFGDTFNLQG